MECDEYSRGSNHPSSGVASFAGYPTLDQDDVSSSDGSCSSPDRSKGRERKQREFECEKEHLLDEKKTKTDPTEDWMMAGKGRQNNTTRRTKLCFCVILGVFLISLLVGLLLRLFSGHDVIIPDPSLPLPPTESKLGRYSSAAVATDSEYCSKIGKSILEQSGSAADAALSILFCVGVTVPQSTGIGGGFMAVFYSAKTKKATVLDAREVAPASAHMDMFGTNDTMAEYGIHAVAVPGEVRGYIDFYKQEGGKVNWRDLVQPSIDLCQNGVPVTAHMANALREKEEHIMKQSNMFRDYIDQSTGRILKEGDTLFRPKYCETLSKLASNPEDFYMGEVAKSLVQDIRDAGGNITLNDLASYKTNWTDPVVANLPNGFKMFSNPPPGSGAVLALVLNIFEKFHQPHSELSHLSKKDYEVLWHHRLIEAFKFSYALRHELGDPNTEDLRQVMGKLTSERYAQEMRNRINDESTSQDPKYYGAKLGVIPDDEGTSHISVLAPNGDAVSVTATVNSYFGSVVVSPRTGIVLNNEMGDFTAPGMKNMWGVPPSVTNYIKPGKRPMSSMAPTVIVDKDGKARLVIGAAGGIRITTAISYATIRHLFFNETIKEAIDVRRLHHQLFPMKMSYQYGVTDYIIAGLRSKGHVIERKETFGSVVNGIAVDGNGVISANADDRKKGSVNGFDEIVPDRDGREVMDDQSVS